jgi:hypothetical protein
MAGDPLADVTMTRVYVPGQVWYDTTTSSTYRVVSTVRTDEEEEKKKKRIKWFLKQAAILAMKKQWNDKVITKPIPVIRPEGQLRGVCFGGRGWA